MKTDFLSPDKVVISMAAGSVRASLPSAIVMLAASPTSSIRFRVERPSRPNPRISIFLSLISSCKRVSKAEHLHSILWTESLKILLGAGVRHRNSGHNHDGEQNSLHKAEALCSVSEEAAAVHQRLPSVQ